MTIRCFAFKLRVHVLSDKIKKREQRGIAMEKFVETNGHKNYVYCYGQGAAAVVILSGSGVPFPSLEYRTLAKELAENFLVIGIEKLGYGHSELADDSREIDDVVEEYRRVLQELGVKTPVVLMAHSMGFLEALRWGQRYPGEAAAILGLDPATPGCYREFNVEEATKKLIEMSRDEAFRKAAASGLAEQMTEEQEISQTEKNTFESLAFRNLANQNWISEAENLRDTILLVEKDNPCLPIPMLFFLSNGEGTTLEKESWIQYSLQYLSNIKTSQYVRFDYPHNLYKFAYKEIAQKAGEFISEFVESI